MAASIIPDRKMCSKGHPVPRVDSILEAFALEDSNVLNIYVVGSHMWTTCQVGSDWDLVVIVKELSSAKPFNHHKANMEAFILSREQYIDKVTSHSLQVLITLWLPQECVLRELFNPRTPFHFSRDSLVSAIEHHRERDFRISRKHFLKNDRKKAKKILLHLIQYLTLGIQIKTSGQITDYVAAAHQYRDLVLNNHSDDWSELLKVVSPIVDSLWISLLT